MTDRVAAFQDGARAATRLREALAEFDLTLPSLRTEGPVDGCGYIHLGGASAETVWRLARYLKDDGEAGASHDGPGATAALREALAHVGLALPSLRAGEPADGRGYVDLGGAGAEFVHRLAEHLRTIPARS